MSDGIIKPPFGAQLNLSHPLAQGLVGAWIFNEGSGKYANDSSYQGNTGTLSGFNDPPIATSGWNAGPHGGALAFDGNNDYVESSVFSFGSQISMVIWLKRTIAVPWGHPILIPYTTTWTPPFIIFGFEYQAGSDDLAITYANGGPNYSSGPRATIPNNVWSQVVGTYDGTKASIYLNGVFVMNETKTWDSVITQPLRIGATGVVGSLYPFAGSISSASVYNRALSAEEIAYLYAFPYAMFADPFPAWMAPNNIPKFMNHYKQMRAA